MAKYPIWKKGDKVRIINSTASGNSHQRDIIGRQAVVYERLSRSDRIYKPTYTVKVRERGEAWYDSDYREWNYYTYAATDLAKWGA